MSTWIQVVGIFDSLSKTGAILGVQPARAPKSEIRETSDTKLVALGATGEALSETAVIPEYGSCGDEADVGSFQTFVDLPHATQSLSLQHLGAETSRFAPDVSAASAEGESFGLSLHAGHSATLEPVSPSATNASYILQAREKGTTIWETLDIGLESPDASPVDLKQFPDADVIEVRVLKSTGFESVEIDRREIDFTN